MNTATRSVSNTKMAVAIVYFAVAGGMAYAAGLGQINSLAPSPGAVGCYDSDVQNNNFVQGYVTVRTSAASKQVITTKDVCDGSSVVEYYCKNGESAPDKSLCRSGCVDGVCLPALKIVGESCATASQCVSNKCLNGLCARGDGAEQGSCRYYTVDDECDYGRYCAQSVSGRSSCQRKLADTVACTSSTACMSGTCAHGICVKNSAYSICSISNDIAPWGRIDDSYIESVVAAASDMMYERTGQRFTLQLPIERRNILVSSNDVYTIVPMASRWITESCFTARQNNPPNGVLMYVGEQHLINTNYNGFTIVSDDLSGQGYVSSYPNSHYGTTRIVGGVLKKVDIKQDAVSIFHEIMHQYDADAANVHADQPVCADLLGNRFSEATMLGLSYSAIGWGSMCPYPFYNFAHIEKNLSTRKFIGQRCVADMECQSGLCDSPTGSFLSQIPGPYKMCMSRNLQVGKFCLSDRGCQSGICLALRCQASLPQGNNLPDSSICTSGTQCQSGDCVGSRCFTKLSGGARCGDQNQCRSGVCTDFQCQACTQSSHCSNGLVCVNRQCFPSNFSVGASCLSSEQCQSGSCVNGRCACPLGQTCTGGTNPPSSTVLTNVPQGGNCAATNECSMGLVCANHQCFPGNFTENSSCLDTVQCQSGLECYGGHCILTANVPPIGSRDHFCSVGSECTSGICAGGRCQNSCDANSQCPSGERCSQVDGQNVCLRINLSAGEVCHRHDQCQSSACNNWRCT